MKTLLLIFVAFYMAASLWMWLAAVRVIRRANRRPVPPRMVRLFIKLALLAFAVVPWPAWAGEGSAPTLAVDLGFAAALLAVCLVVRVVIGLVLRTFVPLRNNPYL